MRQKMSVYSLNVDMCKDVVDGYATANATASERDTRVAVESEELRVLKARLNESKNRLEQIPNKRMLLDKFDRLSSLRSKIEGEGVTNAWIKMFEIGTHFKFNYDAVFCNAELPGAFVCAINQLHSNNYELQKRRHKPGRVNRKRHNDLNWAACSYVNGPLSDSLGVFRFNREHWMMNEDMDGDTTQLDNINILDKRVFKKLGRKATLYTADGSIAIDDNYTRQEELNAPLLLGEIVCGFRTLSKGGDCVIKVFTLFEPLTLSMVTLFASCFEKVNFVKPTASRDANSEIYMVGISFNENTKACKYLEDALLSCTRLDMLSCIIPLTNELLEEFAFIIKSITERQINTLDKIYECHLKKEFPPVEEKRFAENLWLSMHKVYKLNYHILQKPAL